ncbi:uncharacterized protein LOC143145125 [Ptiloglossa arizonensis]|uniref:uncharacterized protein LOC143145125 n=1 Tax=Ptiloglossa arizonensis TaxID=3350558 RepID=UPI003F9EE043
MRYQVCRASEVGVVPSNNRSSTIPPSYGPILRRTFIEGEEYVIGGSSFEVSVDEIFAWNGSKESSLVEIHCDRKTSRNLWRSDPVEKLKSRANSRDNAPAVAAGRKFIARSRKTTSGWPPIAARSSGGLTANDEDRSRRTDLHNLLSTNVLDRSQPPERRAARCEKFGAGWPMARTLTLLARADELTTMIIPSASHRTPPVRCVDSLHVCTFSARVRTTSSTRISERLTRIIGLQLLRVFAIGME